ncbi:MAG TPA: hypothetical protein VEL47_06300 [Myxococcota bacterium]|nr:hypothetical protein [Myxococcota bacterium]
MKMAQIGAALLCIGLMYPSILKAWPGGAMAHGVPQTSTSIGNNADQDASNEEEDSDDENDDASELNKIDHPVFKKFLGDYRATVQKGKHAIAGEKAFFAARVEKGQLLLFYEHGGEEEAKYFDLNLAKEMFAGGDAPRRSVTYGYKLSQSFDGLTWVWQFKICNENLISLRLQIINENKDVTEFIELIGMEKKLSFEFVEDWDF